MVEHPPKDALMLNHAKIVELRKAKGLTQEEAGKRASLGKQPRARWNDLERGRKDNVELETLYRIAKVLGVKPADLLE